MATSQENASDVPSSPEDGGNFRRSLQIDMKGLVGDAVGNMSISPSSRDVVLAARKGLFIIDLEAPLNVPRFLPQGGTWDVADVQWNPHPARKEYIVSTSSEKLLIWNLYLSGKTSIEHILRSHYRAITDINWHTSDPDIVVSTGIDAWLWAWDLRTAQKPIMGLSAFNSGATQVKWNRQDGNILASSHMNQVLVWDRRKGSLPVVTVRVHGAKIYGIDWSHENRNELATCSLDKTIKVWDYQRLADSHGSCEPTYTIHTSYPVWRARNLPFGQGLLSLPQRGETALEMWTPQDLETPVERFEGHTDVVKEFVWRKGGQDNSEFQLITWSKDRTLRFWPLDSDTMQKVGPSSKAKAPTTTPAYFDERVSFSNPPIGSDMPPALSAPVGHRSILAEVRASQPPRAPKTNPFRHLHDPSHARMSSDTASKIASIPEVPSRERGATMSRGYVGGRSAQITTFAWLSSVKVGQPSTRDSSSGPTSGGESATQSRLNSRSRPPSVMDPSLSFLEVRAKSSSRDRDKGEDERRESDSNHSLQDEIMSVVNTLTASKVKLEKVDLTKRRTCTFGLHGPWGETTSVFIRVTFTFPRDYPQAAHPGGTPQVELERNPLISMKSRVHILRRLRVIREQERPCLESCLRFLLFGDEARDDPSLSLDSESSSEDELAAIPRRNKDGQFSAVRGDKNLAEPRTSQGVFGPNGELICFFRATPRIVKPAYREVSKSPSAKGSQSNPESAPRLLWSPILLSDAMRKLALAANDREVESLDIKRSEDAHSILRIMSSLFNFSPQKTRRVSDQSTKTTEQDNSNGYSLVPVRRSTVYIKDASTVVGVDVAAAREYVFSASEPVAACKKNAGVAKLHRRLDHERIFNILEVLLIDIQKSSTSPADMSSLYSICNPLTVTMMEKLYAELCLSKDIQMLAMISVALLRLAVEMPQSTPSPGGQHMAHHDYFNYKRFPQLRQSPMSPAWSRGTPPGTNVRVVAPPLSSPSSSRGSWSSLFNTTSMRKLISASKSGGPPPGNRAHYSPPSPTQKRDSSSAPTGKSWSEASEGTSASRAGNSLDYVRRRPTFSQVVSSRTPQEEKKRVVVEIAPHMKVQRSMFRLQPRLRRQLEAHVWAYAEMLLAWELPHKRAELLECTRSDLMTDPSHPALLNMLDSSPLGVVRACSNCDHDNHPNVEFCSECGARLVVERCSICRLPVRGLSHVCLECRHPTHVRCWKLRKDTSCPTGCGCNCPDSITPASSEMRSPSSTRYNYISVQ